MQWEPAKVNCKGWMITVWKPGTLPYDVMVWPNAIWACMRGNQGSVVSHRDSPRRVFYNAPWAQCGEMETEEERAEVQSCALPRRLSSKQRKPWQLDWAQSTSPAVTQTSLEGTIGTAIVLFHVFASRRLLVRWPTVTRYFKWKTLWELQNCTELSTGLKNIKIWERFLCQTYSKLRSFIKLCFVLLILIYYWKTHIAQLVLFIVCICQTTDSDENHRVYNVTNIDHSYF